MDNTGQKMTYFLGNTRLPLQDVLIAVLYKVGFLASLENCMLIQQSISKIAEGPIKLDTLSHEIA